MSLEWRLAEQLIQKHPERAAVALEVAGLEESRRVLSRAAPMASARVLQRMPPGFGSQILEAFEIADLVEVLEALPLDVAVRVLRGLSAERAELALQEANPRRSRALRSLLRFPAGSAGSLMDPDVLALPDTLTAREALDRVREAAESARYNLYIVDSTQRLVGVVNLRELLMERPAARLADFMVRDPQRLEAHADRSAVVAHRGWREVHSLPVVDEHGAYLGAIRYRTLRSLEDQFFRPAVEDADASAALGELFAAGAGALLDAVSIQKSTKGA